MKTPDHNDPDLQEELDSADVATIAAGVMSMLLFFAGVSDPVHGGPFLMFCTLIGVMIGLPLYALLNHLLRDGT